jgi:hypothetical protein
MSREIQTIARALRSESHLTHENGDLLLLIIEGRRLIEKVYDDGELKDQRMVAVGVMEGTTAAYATVQYRVSIYTALSTYPVLY